MIEFNKKNIRTWSMLGPSGVLGLAVCELGENDSHFAVLTADLCNFSGLDRFQKLYKERFYNIGIAEQNMVGIAAGMVKEDMNVFATTYATFATTRVLDQVKVNMGYMQLPITLIGLTSGFSVGILGATHMSIEDISIIRSIPNIVVFSPADCTEMMKVLLIASQIKSPVYIRMSGSARTPIVYKEDYKFEIGKSVTLRNGQEICIMATGTMVYTSLCVASILEKLGFSVEVINFHTIKPIDEDVIVKCCSKKLIVSVEEHSIKGGFGSAISEVLAQLMVKPPQLMLGVRDYYPHASSYENLLVENRLTAEKIAEDIVMFIQKNKLL